MQDTHIPARAAGLFRRLAALFYDSLLLLAIWFVATALLLPFTEGEALPPNNPLLSTYLLFISVFFTHIDFFSINKETAPILATAVASILLLFTLNSIFKTYHWGIT